MLESKIFKLHKTVKTKQKEAKEQKEQEKMDSTLEENSLHSLSDLLRMDQDLLDE